MSDKGLSKDNPEASMMENVCTVMTGGEVFMRNTKVVRDRDGRPCRDKRYVSQ